MKPSLAAAATVAVILAGIAALREIPRSVFPDFTLNRIRVSAHLPGASAEEVESRLTVPIENAISRLPGVESVASFSRESGAELFVTISRARSMHEARAEIQGVLDAMSSRLPSRTVRPFALVLDSSMRSLLKVAIQAAGRDVEAGRLIEAARRMEASLQSVPGLGGLQIKGLPASEIRVAVEPSAVASGRVDFRRLVHRLKDSLVSVPAGTAAWNSGAAAQEAFVRVAGRADTPSDLERITFQAGSSVLRVKDVARVNRAIRDPDTLIRINGRPGVLISIHPGPGADAVELSDAVRAAVAAAAPAYPELKIEVTNDRTRYISDRLDTLGWNLTVGLVLLVLVLLVFLPPRLTIVVALGVPFSISGTFVAMSAAGVSLNVMSLLGLILVSGMLVDDGVVVTDSIRSAGGPKAGVRRVAVPVALSSLTTVLAFLPIFFLDGRYGDLTAPVPFTVVVALLVSLLECLLLLPLHVSAISRPADPDSRRSLWERSAGPVLTRWLERAIRGVIRRRGIAAVMLILGALGCVGLGTRMRVTLFPQGGVEALFIMAQTEPGTPLRETERRMASVESILKKHMEGDGTRGPRIEDFHLYVGSQSRLFDDPESRKGPEYAQFIVFTKGSAGDLAGRIRNELASVSGILKLSVERADAAASGGKALNVVIRGESFRRLGAAADSLVESLDSVEHVSDVSHSLVAGRPEYRLHIDYDDPASVKIDHQELGLALRAAGTGIEIGSAAGTPVRLVISGGSLDEPAVKRGNELMDVIDQLPGASAVAFSRHEPKQQIVRSGGRREVRVSARMDDQGDLAATGGRVEGLLSAMRSRFPDLEFSTAGDLLESGKSFASLGRIFVLSLGAIALLLFGVYRRWTSVVFVLGAVPFGVMASVVVYACHGVTWSFISILGVIGLSGVVVNHLILLLHRAREIEEDCGNRAEAWVRAATDRFRPVFLTSITTFVAVLPTAYGIGGMDAFVRPMALALGWGTMLVALSTLLVAPALVLIASDAARLLLPRKPDLSMSVERSGRSS